MADDIGTWTRPRGQAWGNEAQRAVLRAIAEDIASRSGYRVVAIEALRSDGFLEFVAIAGNPAASAELLGRASPLLLDRLLALGSPVEGWVHTPGERLDDEDRAWIAQYGHIPDRPQREGPDAWHADDQLVRLLESESGELRALLYLDEPLAGLRPTDASMAAINTEVGVLFDAIISIVESELYGEQVRMVTQVRSAIERVRPGLGVVELLAEMSQAMAEAMDVTTVNVISASTEIPEIESDRRHIAEMMQLQWQRRGHLLVEPQRTWGMDQESMATPPSLARLMTANGLGSGLLVPIGAGEEYLGTLSLGRAADGPRWMASEINAATIVAGDLARLVLDARLMERERALSAGLRDLVAHRRDMVHTLAHELRTPVSVLRMHLELIAEDPTGAQAGDSFAAMDRSAGRIENMIEDLMALATVSDAESPLLLAPVDLSAVTREVCDFIEGVAGSSGLDLETSITAGLVVTGDEPGLQRMVGNLVSNAIKYTPAGGRVTLTLEPELLAGREGIRLTCADTGIGIAASDMDHLFIPFFRSTRTEARERPGTGLGLAITEQVVKRHHGTIEVHSELGAGTTFTVWLPLAAGADVR